MKLQYISDSQGKTTGVFIPIEDWNELKNKFKDIEKEEIEMPSWHIDVLNERLEEYQIHPEKMDDFDDALNDIEKIL
jgi:t-SNARE complex subunit (syntaxin)